MYTTATHRLWSDWALSQEAVRVGQMLYAVKRLRGIPMELKTDSCLFTLGLRSKPSFLEHCTFKDLNCRERFEGPGNKLNQHCTPTLAQSDDMVFRVNWATAKDKLGFEAHVPHRDYELQDREHDWCELTEDEVEECVLRGDSVVINGIAGSGKTTLVQGILAKLDAQGHKTCILAPTHSAARRASPHAKTCDHFCRRYILASNRNLNIIPQFLGFAPPDQRSAQQHNTARTKTLKPKAGFYSYDKPSRIQNKKSRRYTKRNQ